jgi:TMEM175 potassium channel family protein
VKVDRGLLWLNGLFLLTICFAPLPTAILAAHPASRPAAFLLAATMLATSAGFSLLRWYASYVGDLLGPDEDPTMIRRAMQRSLVGPACYGAATIAALYSPLLSIALQAVVPVVFLVPMVIERRDASY